MGFWIWLGIGIILFLIAPGLGFWYVIISGLLWAGDDTEGKESKRSTKQEKSVEEKPFNIYDKTYGNGVARVENISKTGYYYSDGNESWVDMLGNEHRENGEVVVENAYISGRRDIYKDNECVGYEYEDACGVTQRSK